MAENGETSTGSGHSSSEGRAERARTLRVATLAQSNEPVPDPTAPAEPPSRYPKVMRAWPPGGRNGPLDDYPGLTDIRRQYRVVKPTEVMYMSESKKRTERMVQRPVPGGGSVGVLGINRPWQGNYSHPADTGVSVEDLEHIGIEENALVQALRAHLPNLGKKTIDELRNDGAITGPHKVSDTSRLLTEEFTFLNLPTVRFWFKEIDVSEKIAKNSIAIETEQLNDQLLQGQYAGAAWELEVEQLAAAEILWGCDDWLPGRSATKKSGKKEDKHRLCVKMAFRLFYKDREFLRRICKDVVDGPDCYFRRYPTSVHDELKLALKDIKFYYDGETRARDVYWQLARDQWMADNGQWEHWKGKKIVIALDKNQALLHWIFAEAVQSLCPAGTLTRMDNAIKAYAWLNPVTRAGQRFDVNKEYHLLNNPQHDFQRLEESNAPELAIHQAVCGVEHMGAHNEQGKMNKILQQVMHMKKKFDNLPGEEYGWTQFEKLQYGAMGIGTKISRFFLELLDPALFGQYISNTENIPQQFKVDTVRNENGKDCFSYRALNYNTHTEDHLDSGDHNRGVAGLQISGDFTGGDFILRDTKQMFELLSGSQGFVRGAVQRHCTRAWTGDSRTCQVMTIKQSVWNKYRPEEIKDEDEDEDKEGPKKRKRETKDKEDPEVDGEAEEEPLTKRRATKTTKEAQAAAGNGSTSTMASTSNVGRGGRPAKVKGTLGGKKKGSLGR